MTVPFLETPVFPDGLSFWANGGLSFKTGITPYSGGFESRTSWWETPLGAWDLQNVLRAFVQNAGGDPNTQTHALGLIRNFHRIVKGQAYGFRFRDWTDYTDEGIGILGTGLGDGGATYQLNKKYTVGSMTDTRAIVKPRDTPILGGGDPALKIFKNAVQVAFGTGSGQVSVDYTTGIATFHGTLPTSGDVLTWTGCFDVVARFGNDQFQATPDPQGLYVLQSLPVMEYRLT